MVMTPPLLLLLLLLLDALCGERGAQSDVRANGI
jgi:hypothetical protein